MAIFRILEDNTAVLVKSVKPEDELKFLKANEKGKIKFVRVAVFPHCEFETWKYNPDTGQIEIDENRFVKKAIRIYSEKLKNLEFARLQKILNQYGYKDLGDIQYWQRQDPEDPELIGLLDWYASYDNAIWDEIDALKKKGYNEFKNYNPFEIEAQIFEATKVKLPPNEE